MGVLKLFAKWMLVFGTVQVLVRVIDRAKEGR